MKKIFLNKKGIVLIISMLVMTVVLILTGVYFSSLLTEYRSVDTEKSYLQALGVAEAQVNYGLCELRQRIQGDHDTPGNPLGLKGRIKDNQPIFNFANYSNNPLRLLQDYAYAYNESTFQISGVQATLSLTPYDLGSTIFAIEYINPTITVSSAQLPYSRPDSEYYEFYYNYSIESKGPQDTRGERVLTLDRQKIIASKTIKIFGSFQVTIFRTTFAKFALFTNHHRTPGGTTVWFTANTNFTGPVHSNERFSFANNPSATFTEEVAQHLTTARFYNNGWPILLNADSNPPRDVPTFQAGFTRGAPLINLPSSVTQQDLLNQSTGNRSPGAFTTNGIYLPNEGGVLDGGIYIRGNSSNLTMGVDVQNRPVYTITQETNTKQISIDYTNNQTIVTNVSGSGGTPAGTYNGIPDGVGNEGVIIYDNGSISNFSGTVQSNTKLTVSSDKDIVINNHIKYQSYNAGPPPDALGYNNLLGILSWNGDVRIGTGAPNDLNIHGIVMATGRDHIFTVDNYNVGSPRGTVTLLGGVITDFYGPFGTFSGTQQISGYGRNFVYDARMLQGQTPPYFPYLSGLDTSDTGLSDKPKWQDKGV